MNQHYNMDLATLDTVVGYNYGLGQMCGNEAAVPDLHYLEEFEDAVGADVEMKMESV